MTTKNFQYSKTILNLSSLLCFVITVIYTIFNWDQLSEGEGWGVIAVIAMSIYILSALIVDIILQFFIRNKKTLNIVGSIVVLVYVVIFFYL